MRCRHQRAWPLRTELLEKPSCLRTGSEGYKGRGGGSMQMTSPSPCSSKEKNGTKDYSPVPSQPYDQ